MSPLLYNSAGIMIPPALKGFLFGSRTIIVATGNTSYTPPRYAKYLYFQLQGAGGGGKNCANSSAGQVVLGGGGSAGVYSEFASIPFALAWTITLGTGGSGTTGAAGGSSSIIAPSAWTNSGSATLTVCQSPGGSGGGTLATGTAETIVAPTNGATSGTSLAGISVNGPTAYECHRVSGTVARSGRGADSHFGPGGKAVIAQGAGNNAGGKGAGGSGGMSVNAGGAVNGGNGGDAMCVIWEYY